MIANMTPNERYQQDLRRSGFVADRLQKEAVQHTQRLYEEILNAPANKPGWLARLLGRRAASITGLYFMGGTGRGKTYLVDSFYECLPFPRKHRVHFHRFMLDIHVQLRQLPASPDPLKIIGRQLAQHYRILCLDEFHVHDIGDAMIMSGLLDAMFGAGLILVTTSNIAIEDLYRNGLQRERFMPAIELLQHHVRQVDLQSGTDFRLNYLACDEVLQVVDEQQSHRLIEAKFDVMAPAKAKHNRSMTINHRAIPYRALADDTVWFDFQVLCNTPRAASDYIEIACQFHTVFLSHIVVMDEGQDDIAKRFIHLIDALYDHGVKLVATVAAEPAKLYRGRRLAFAFERTSSRLVEMASQVYLARPHRSEVNPGAGGEYTCKRKTVIKSAPSA